MKLVNLELLLPEDIPAGENVLWYGKPEVVSLARRAFRADIVAIYFALMSLWNFGTDAVDKGLAARACSRCQNIGCGGLGACARLLSRLVVSAHHALCRDK
jgi:hypothetical protein